MATHDAHRGVQLYGSLQERESLGDPSRQGIRVTQGRGKHGEPDQEIFALTGPQAPFEPGNGLREVSFIEVQDARTETRLDAIGWVVDPIGCLPHCSSPRNALGEFSQVGKTSEQPGINVHGWQAGQAEVCRDVMICKTLHVPPEEVYG
jgi:hypothetical protein